MKLLIESLKRMYENGKITRERLLEMVEKGTITIENYDYITGTDSES
jgi:hypothetical protein